MTLEEARNTINTTGSSQEDVLAANKVLNTLSSQYGAPASRFMSADPDAVKAETARRAPAVQDYGFQYSGEAGRNPLYNPTPETAAKVGELLGFDPQTFSGPSSGPFDYADYPGVVIGGANAGSRPDLHSVGLIGDYLQKWGPEKTKEFLARQSGTDFNPASYGQVVSGQASNVGGGSSMPPYEDPYNQTPAPGEGGRQFPRSPGSSDGGGRFDFFGRFGSGRGGR